MRIIRDVYEAFLYGGAALTAAYGLVYFVRKAFAAIKDFFSKKKE